MKSSLYGNRRSVNPRVTIQPEKLAAAFVEQNPISGPEIDEILDLYSRSEFQAAKDLWWGLVLPSALHKERYLRLRQFGGLLFKADKHRPSLESTALQKFLQVETSMSETNTVLGFDRSLPTVPEPIRSALLRARSVVYSALPPLDSVVKQILLLARPGPGQAIGIANQYRTAAVWKYGACAPICTPGAVEYSRWLIASSPMWRRALTAAHYAIEPSTLHNNEVLFVPKDCTSLRTIAKEPSLNVMIQLGVHEFLVPRLAALGCNILDQSRNQKLARLGSQEGHLATLDLSAASDSISLALLRQLLPPDWFTFLSLIRSPFGKLPDGRVIRYEKYASMGNGTTFALETLVFYALCRAIVPTGTVSVYGDDIIVPQLAVPRILELFSGCGLVVNSTKSFWEGPFRESCGADWYNGELVTPVYWRNKTSCLTTECYSFLNQLPPRFSWGKVREYITAQICKKTKITFGLSTSPVDSCLHAPESYLRGIGALRWSEDNQRWNHAVIRFKPTSDRGERTPNLALCALASGTTVSALPLRRVGHYRLGYVLDPT